MMNTKPAGQPRKLPIRRRFWLFVSWHARVFYWVFEYLVVRRAWFLAPLIIIMMLMGLVIFATANPAVSPFLYALF
ncbi:MAG: hypothetical protein JJU11_05755 [Candidatus Sumerlaeia bacterium]|nr:hypothetical protein [Candidatus Sumerlaeia bacterium]